MKKILITLVVAMLTTTAFAQDNNQRRPRMNQEEMVKMQTEHMAQEYGLDQAQQAKLLELNTKFAGKLHMRGPRGQRGGRGVDAQSGATQQAQPAERPSREEMEARMKEIQAQRENYNNELKGILTEEQFAKYQAAEKQRMERRGRGGRGPQGGPRRDNQNR